jgi:hypothetical protein
VKPESVLRARLHAQHLDGRLPASAFVEAAFGGLQDSAPRTALLSLHARCEGVGPDSWEADGLAQVWGPRRAVYVVPSDAVAAFTLGRLPRDERRADAILGAGERAAKLLSRGSAGPQGDLEAELGLERGALRTVALSGRLLLRWDARTTTVTAAPVPEVDAETARLDLARRYLAWFGPATAAQFAAWAGVDEADAGVTLDAVGRAPELPVPSESAGQVRLLPPGDPYLFRDRRHLVADKRQFEELFRPKGHLAGGLLVDGEIVGTWSRQQRKVTVRPWQRVDEDRLAAEVELMSAPLGGKVALTIA